MIKAIVIGLFLFITTTSPDLKKIRSNFALMNKQEEAVNTIKEISLTSKEVSVNLKRAYYAAAEMTSAQYKINPAAKIKAFNSGKKILEATILADTSDLEARYIRFTIQQNAPSFLGYNKSISSDKNYIIKHLNQFKTADPELFSSVYAYLLTYGKLNSQEKALIDK
jgi:hypothetical protein